MAKVGPEIKRPDAEGEQIDPERPLIATCKMGHCPLKYTLSRLDWMILSIVLRNLNI